MLLHTCGPRCQAHEHGTSSGAMQRRGRRGRAVTYDLHCHVLVPEVESLVAGHPGRQEEQQQLADIFGPESTEYNRQAIATLGPALTDISIRLRRMDEMGVDVQVLSPSPLQYYYWADRQLSGQIVEANNAAIAALCAAHPDRFLGLGNASLQFPELAVQQLERAVLHHGLRGIEVSSTVNGMELADPLLAPVWECAERLNATVFLHPWGTSIGPRVNRYYLGNTIGQPLETTLALSHLIFSGTLDRFPNLRLCAAHGGGFLPWYSFRSDHSHAVRPEAKRCLRPPSEYLQRIYFDTVIYEPEHLRTLVSNVGVSQVVLGTDYPFDMGNYDVHRIVGDASGLSPSEIDQVLGGNARRLLNLN